MKGKDPYATRQGKLHHVAYGNKGPGGSGSAAGKVQEENSPKFAQPQVRPNFPSFAFELSVLLVLMTFHLAQLFAVHGQIDVAKHLKTIFIVFLCCGGQSVHRHVLKGLAQRVLKLLGLTMDADIIATSILILLLLLTYSGQYALLSTKGLWAFQFVLLNKETILNSVVPSSVHMLLYAGTYPTLLCLANIGALTYTATIFPILVSYHPDHVILRRPLDNMLIFVFCLITLLYTLLCRLYIQHRLSILLFLRKHPSHTSAQMFLPLVELDMTSQLALTRSKQATSSFAVHLVLLVLLILVCAQSTLAVIFYKQRISVALTATASATFMLSIVTVCHYTLNLSQLATRYPDMHRLLSKVDGKAVVAKVDLLTKCQQVLKEVRIVGENRKVYTSMSESDSAS